MPPANKTYGANSLFSAIAQIVQKYTPALTQRNLQVELDIDVGLGSVACTQNIINTLTALLERAASRSPFGGEILISAVSTPNAIEIEIADAGQMGTTDKQQNVSTAYNSGKSSSSRTYLDNTRSIANVVCMNCPQGGMAWTLVIPLAMAAQHAA